LTQTPALDALARNLFLLVAGFMSSFFLPWQSTNRAG